MRRDEFRTTGKNSRTSAAGLDKTKWRGGARDVFVVARTSLCISACEGGRHLGIVVTLSDLQPSLRRLHLLPCKLLKEVHM